MPAVHASDAGNQKDNPLINTFTDVDFSQICNDLAQRDPDLAWIIDQYGYPPMWSRPNTYETLVHIILEQQVSLASAKAALEKLRAKVIDITPENVAALTDEDLRAAYFSRQKITYVKDLTAEVLSGRLDIVTLSTLTDDQIRDRLIKLKGIGNWTIDVYLSLVLHRTDIFPVGDVAAVTALKELKQLPKGTSADVLISLVDRWRPHRSIGTILLWHFYLTKRNREYA